MLHWCREAEEALLRIAARHRDAAKRAGDLYCMLENFAAKGVGELERCKRLSQPPFRLCWWPDRSPMAFFAVLEQGIFVAHVAETVETPHDHSSAYELALARARLFQGP